MVQDEIRKLTSEPVLIFIIIFSLAFIRLTTNETLAIKITTVYLTMALGIVFFYLLQLNGFGINIRSQSGNTVQALLYAGISLAVLFGSYKGVIYLFTQSVIPQITATKTQLTQSMFSTILQSIKFGEIDISQSPYFNYFTYGVLIPITETLFIVYTYGFLAYIRNINISDNTSWRNWGLRILIALGFLYFHLKVRGVNNNIALAMTFLFAVVTLFLAGKFREYESANYLHIGWNTLSLALG